VILLSFIGGLRTFDIIWTTTRGGPGFASDVLTSVIYKQYQAGFYGLSVAGNVVLFTLIMCLVYPMMRYFNHLEIEL
jgi:raffinose/stachyose/melibiose transport system permease protein